MNVILFITNSEIALSINSCQNVLTKKVVIAIIHYDKESCQNKETKHGGDVLALKNHLKEYRSKLGLNQTELGHLAGVSRQTISLIERGDYSPSVTLALKIAKICEATVEDLFEYEEE